MTRRVCTLHRAKVRYSTYKRAIRAALSLYHRGETETLNTVYFCRAVGCGGYHLTSGNNDRAGARRA